MDSYYGGEGQPLPTIIVIQGDYCRPTGRELRAPCRRFCAGFPIRKITEWGGNDAEPAGLMTSGPPSRYRTGQAKS